MTPRERWAVAWRTARVARVKEATRVGIAAKASGNQRPEDHYWDRLFVAPWPYHTRPRDVARIRKARAQPQPTTRELLAGWRNQYAHVSSFVEDGVNGLRDMARRVAGLDIEDVVEAKRQALKRVRGYKYRREPLPGARPSVTGPKHSRRDP